MGIAPNNISEEEFISHYNNYDKRNFRDIVYNNIKGNGYEIVVYLDGDKVGLIFGSRILKKVRVGYCTFLLILFLVRIKMYFYFKANIP